MNKRLIPNTVTMVNLSLGFISLFLTMEGLQNEAAYAIFGAMIMDSMDGRLARRLQVASDFGKELDSLSDLVSFGVAPALLAYSMELNRWGYWGLLMVIGFALCGAYRLARFNVLSIKTHFVGVPITFCGPILTLLLLLTKWIQDGWYPVFTVILAYLMVCNIKVPKI
jgi:CDP-diacylglycerol--serine O-phosphatidyltransferase